MIDYWYLPRAWQCGVQGINAECLLILVIAQILQHSRMIKPRGIFIFFNTRLIYLYWAA